MPIRLTRGGRLMVTNLDNVLFKYVSQGNPKSNEDLKRFLRLYPSYRGEIIDSRRHGERCRFWSGSSRLLIPSTSDCWCGTRKHICGLCNLTAREHASTKPKAKAGCEGAATLLGRNEALESLVYRRAHRSRESFECAVMQRSAPHSHA